VRPLYLAQTASPKYQLLIHILCRHVLLLQISNLHTADYNEHKAAFERIRNENENFNGFATLS
jgi:hypothetical protein